MNVLANKIVDSGIKVQFEEVGGKRFLTTECEGKPIYFSVNSNEVVLCPALKISGVGEETLHTILCKIVGAGRVSFDDNPLAGTPWFTVLVDLDTEYG